MNIEFLRYSLEVLCPITDEQIKNRLREFRNDKENDLFLIGPYLEEDETIKELGDIVRPKVVDWSPKEYLPIALSARYIYEATGETLRDAVYEKADVKLGMVGLSQELMEQSVFLDDLADGILATMYGVYVATRKITPDVVSERVQLVLDYTMSKYPNATNTADLTRRLAQEDLLQARLLREDPTGALLVDYWVRVQEERIDEAAANNLKPTRIKEFVMEGASVARELYNLVYPLAKRI